MSISEQIIICMRSTALVLNEYDEVPVSSNEVLEANVVAIRTDLTDLKNDFRAAVARLGNDIKSAVMRLEAEIRAVAAKAASDLEKFADRVDRQFDDMRQDMREMRAEGKALRDTVDDNYKVLNAKIDATHDKLSAKIDTTNEKLGNLDRKVTDIGTKLTALLWVVGGLGTLVTVAITVGKAFNWF
jgi:predicted  nucleic acid-binding Zn-ribbon protein